MLRKALELCDVTIIPSIVNNGTVELSKFDYGVRGAVGEVSLPVFAEPNPEIVDDTNWKLWGDYGIRTIIPKDISLATRMKLSFNTFCEFTLQELSEVFLGGNQVGTGYFISIWNDINGHDLSVFEVAKRLKEKYGNRVVLMAGPVANPKTFLEWSRLGVLDYITVGMFLESKGALSSTGIYYPIVTLLEDIKVTAAGVKVPKIIVNGGIEGPDDILKCIVLGADYVIVGERFCRLAEAAGECCERIFDTCNEKYVPFKGDLTSEVLKVKSLHRKYARDKYVRVSGNLKSWTHAVYQNFQQAFILEGATNWDEFKKNSSYIY